MPREFSRGRKVADLIQRELAIMIQREVKDPRIGMVTINEATVSRDLAYADIYFTVLPAENTDGVEEVLNQAGGFLRSQLAKILKTRTTPRLRFHYDSTIETGARLNKAIDDAVAQDKNQESAPESAPESDSGPGQVQD
ncbi:MAG: 30S ribosome-binding factor RbfA [Gammaproteobacteria bacterium]|jgi:ribosome-binding factor A|nr:30S ribosome-binding factor RbfA [Gammaproteobacteria bacterium]MBT4492865.1 30S ribosome-binding factor RbfA [Gammaproteobacteria bacterium]MBT7369140.1 30S ribosome-binding factor RbfA [Gammaproteobacteria bacterium]